MAFNRTGKNMNQVCPIKAKENIVRKPGEHEGKYTVSKQGDECLLILFRLFGM